MKSIHWKYDQQEIPFDPKFRKATELMRLVAFGLNEMSEQLESLDVSISDTDLYFCSLHGEVDPTYNFLKGIAERDWARPFLFQNSLHHSTTGFVSQQYGVLGPSYSICAVENAQKEILQVGKLLSKQKERPILFMHGEFFPEDLSKISHYSAERTCEMLFIHPEQLEQFFEMNSASSFEELFQAFKGEQ